MQLLLFKWKKIVFRRHKKKRINFQLNFHPREKPTNLVSLRKYCLVSYFTYLQGRQRRSIPLGNIFCLFVSNIIICLKNYLFFSIWSHPWTASQNQEWGRGNFVTSNIPKSWNCDWNEHMDKLKGKEIIKSWRNSMWKFHNIKIGIFMHDVIMIESHRMVIGFHSHLWPKIEV